MFNIVKKIIPRKILFNFKYLKTIMIQKRNKKMCYLEAEKKINKQYYKVNKNNIDFNNPRTYTEKLNVSKLYNASNNKTLLTDKISVREWVSKVIGEKYLVPMIGIYDSFDEIDFDKLPEKFVIKCNHDSGSVYVCNNKKEIDYKELKRKYKFFLKRNFGYLNFEMHYKNITPKIIIEKNMGKNIKDYKFLCFDGVPYYCWVDFDRFSNHKRNIYNINWELQPFNQMNYGNYEHDIKKPKNFDEMKKIAEKLSKGFDHVRVDLYDIDDNIYFGEMTFTNGNGMEPIYPQKYDLILGNLWKKFNSKRKDRCLY